MKHRITRKITLGILLAFVLAFSVQGTAEALRFTSQITRTDKPNVSFVYPNETFDLRFTVRLVADTSHPVNLNTKAANATDIDYAATRRTRPTTPNPLIRNHTQITDSEYNAGDTHYYTVTTVAAPDANNHVLTTETRNWMTEEEAYYYNEEAVTITPGSNISIVSINGYTVNAAAARTPYELNEDENWGGTTISELSATTINVKFRAGTTLGQDAVNQISVLDTSIPGATASADQDYPEGDPRATPPTSSPFQITVVQRIPSTTTTIPSLDSVSAASVIRAHETRTPITATLGGTSPNWYEVDFAIASGSSGTLSEKQDGTGNTGRSLTAYTNGSATATVYLNPSRSTTKVQVTVAGRSPGSTTAAHSRTVTIFYQSFNLEADLTLEGPGGNGQSGVVSTRLTNPFVVKVTDGTNRGISGQAVTFAPASGNPATATLFPHLDFRAEPASTGSATAGYSSLVVKTDNSGEAKVHLELGTATGEYTVDATFSGIMRQFRATALSATTTRILRIDTEKSAQEQSVARLTTASKPLVVRVLAGGVSELSGQPVRFTTADGELAPRREATQLTDTTSTPPVPNLPTDRTIETNARGEAWIDYTAGNTEGPVTIYARAYAHTTGGAFTRIDSANTVSFRVNVGGSTSSPQNPQPNPNPNPQPQGTPLTVSQTSITGQPGSTHDITITTSQTAQIGNLVDFSVAGGSVSPGSGSGTFTSTLTLPSQDGTYPLDVTAGTQRVRITVIVSSTATSDTEPGGRLALDVPVSGAPNSSQSVRVTAIDADGNRVPDVDVTLAITSGGGTFSVSRVTTGAAGTATSQLTLGSTPGNDYFVTATAANYPRVEKRISITRTQSSTGDTSVPSAVGEADSIEIDGQRQLSGTVNQATRLRVRVLDATNRGVSGVRVTFRVLAPGQGRLSQRGNGRAVVAETDRSGYATASVTPLGGNLIVEAKAAGVTASVSFIIDVEGGTTPRETSDTTDERTYQVGDKVPISLEDTLTFRGSRTLNGTSYTCVGSGECVVSYGTLVKGEIAATAVPKVQAKTYKTGEKIPISLAATLTFSGKHTLGGTVYTCVSDGECVVSYGILTKGEIEVSTVATPSAGDSPGMSDAKAVVGAANRPVMYWIAGGGLYRLAGASAEQLAESATDVAVGRDKLYWIEQTSETRGAIHHANLDGSDAAVIKTLTSVPKGVALANGKLYITNGWGKIQRMNVDGTQFETNFLTNLGAPLRIAVSGSRVYWTDGSGRVRSAPLQGTKAIQNIVTGSGMLGGIVADGSKVYWTEQTGARSGRVRAANLDGTGITNAYTVTATLHGLALDPANQQLYWTNGWGKVQRGVRGSRYQDVVTGLMTPTALAIGSANTATPMTATKPASTASEPNYDVDGSGTVDNADLFLVSLAVGTDNAQYDVNGDGTVNDKDIALVRDNRDNGAAAAPMVFGVKLTAEQVGRLQAQIDLLIVSGDRSPDALKTLVYLQQLIATARPEQTQLLANYPNPFNPETWIPYELATDTDVRITIYAANGVVVRTLQLGQQSAGYYTDRERAAYWDGRNASGEQVASGVYFYQLETDEMSSLRKMVILK